MITQILRLILIHYGNLPGNSSQLHRARRDSYSLLQPQNIVLMSEFPNCEIKLCDLEVSRVIQDTEDLREIIGTPDYVGECCMTCGD